MDEEFLEAINEIKHERQLNEDVVVQAVSEALKEGFKHELNLGDSSEFDVNLDLNKPDLTINLKKQVVESVWNPVQQVDTERARSIDPDAEAGDEIWVPLSLKDLSRTATHEMKLEVQRLIDTGVREDRFEKYRDQTLELVNGVIQRKDEKTVYVTLDDQVRALLPYREQMDNDDYNPGNRMKFLIVKVALKEEQLLVVVSRTHPEVVRKLFNLHIPEVHDDLIEVKKIAREAGSRSKVAVQCNDPTLDPIGTCVGPQGSRIQSIVDELNDEKIDIIPYSDNLETFIENALSPAEITRVNLLDDEQTAQVVVPDDQLSLAIGKNGANARLTAELCEWAIDIYSEQEFAEFQSEAAQEVAASIFKDAEEEKEFNPEELSGIGPATAESMEEAGLDSPSTILEEGVETLIDIDGIGDSKAESIVEEMQERAQEVGQDEDEPEGDADVGDEGDEDETAEDVKEAIFEDG